MWGSNKYRVAALPVPLASGVILGSEGPQALLRNKEKFPLWVKAQHEGALPPPCIVLKEPRVPHNTKGHCHPRASSAKTRGFHTQLDEGPETP